MYTPNFFPDFLSANTCVAALNDAVANRSSYVSQSTFFNFTFDAVNNVYNIRTATTSSHAAFPNLLGLQWSRFRVEFIIHKCGADKSH
jgi:hypothetical protein